MIDGGLSDNLAARALLRTFSPEVLNRLVEKKLKRVMLIQVNAKGESQRSIDSSAVAPSAFEITKTVVFNPLDVTTALSAYISKTYWVSLIRNANGAMGPVAGARSADITFYPVQVDFDQMVTGSADQRRAKDIGTNWSMKEGELELVDRAGKDLLLAHPCFNAFMAHAGAVQAVNVVNGCDKVEVGQLALAPAAVPGAPVAPPSPASLMPPPVPTSEKLSFSADAYFHSGKASLLAAGKAKLDDLNSSLQNIHLEVIIAVGHTDATGADDDNQRLSMRRAEAVKAYLMAKGIASDRIYIEGKGEKQPAGPNQTVAGRAKNRRVEIEVVGTRRK